MFKKIGNCIYVHKSNITELRELLYEDEFNRIREAESLLPNDFDFAIVKFDKKSSKVSFISSSDWDTAREPIVGDSYSTSIFDFRLKFLKSKGQIYHHKWMFVSSDYAGFNIDESKTWSKQWTSILPNERGVKSRIGYRKYWNEILNEYGLQ